MKDPKTPDQLQREIDYYNEQIQRTTSRDRIRRATNAIRVRQRELDLAQRVRQLDGSEFVPEHQVCVDSKAPC